ncbi:MAG: hypothetical protein GY839_08610 [candidate division Zixibacteria bacterium]|nr:hypothetical protein [candidate division Zixibacteria bacterium]
MINLLLTKYKSRLDYLYSKASNFSDDSELVAEWSKYLCVLTSGYLENCIRAIYSEYIKKRSHPNVSNFAQYNLNAFQNPKMEKICQLAGFFNSSWAEDLRKGTEGELKDGVDSIVANRNIIAHGRDVGLTYSNLLRYYENAQSVLKILNDQVNNN